MIEVTIEKINGRERKEEAGLRRVDSLKNLISNES